MIPKPSSLFKLMDERDVTKALQMYEELNDARVAAREGKMQEYCRATNV